MTDKGQVIAPEQKDFSIKAKIFLYKDADEISVMTTINAKLNEYKISLSEKLGKNVIKTQISAILNSIYGVLNVESQTHVADMEISESQWENLVNFEIEIGGYAEE